MGKILCKRSINLTRLPRDEHFEKRRLFYTGHDEVAELARRNYKKATKKDWSSRRSFSRSILSNIQCSPEGKVEKLIMVRSLAPDEQITAAWLSAVLRQSDVLAQGEVLSRWLWGLLELLIRRPAVLSCTILPMHLLMHPPG